MTIKVAVQLTIFVTSSLDRYEVIRPARKFAVIKELLRPVNLGEVVPGRPLPKWCGA